MDFGGRKTLATRGEARQLTQGTKLREKQRRTQKYERRGQRKTSTRQKQKCNIGLVKMVRGFKTPKFQDSSPTEPVDIRDIVAKLKAGKYALAKVHKGLF